MKISLLLPLLMVFSLNSIAQSFLPYYQGINAGKKALAADSLHSGIKHYYETFEKYDFAFARDCFNAIELAAAGKDSDMMDYFVKRALKQGIDIGLLADTKHLIEFRTTPHWKEIEQQKDSLAAIYKKSINWSIRKEIIQMFEEDQQIREVYYKAPFFQRKKIGKRWEDLNLRQVERLIEITKKHGFPGEKLIGIDTEEMHPKIRNKNLSAGMPIVLFIHHFSQPNASYDSILIEEVVQGNLNNEHFATICDFEAAFGKGEYPNNGFYALKHFPKKFVKEEFREKRRKIGLLSNLDMEELNKSNILTKFWNHLY